MSENVSVTRFGLSLMWSLMADFCRAKGITPMIQRVAAVAILSVFCIGCSQGNRNATSDTNATTNNASVASDRALNKGGKWEYQASQNEMDDKTLESLGLQSDNLIRGFLGNNDVQPILMVGCKGNELRVAVNVQVPAKVEWGGENTVRLRFDGDPPLTEKWLSGNSTGILFSKSPNRFVEKLRVSKTLRFEYTQFAAGTEVAKFAVVGFDYLGPKLKTCLSQ